MEELSVLIIDDDIWMQRILSRTLQSYGFKSTYLSSNGFDGIAIAVENKPSLIIMDILMPEMSGHITLKVLKSIKATRSIPVLMVSALSDTENLGLAVKSGTSGFISKPFTRATVYEKLIGIFGKERIDQLSRNELMENLQENGSNNNNLLERNLLQQDRSSVFETKAVPAQTQPGYEEVQPQPPPKPLVSKDQIMHHYQESEKRSIESIKKLLQKSRK